MKKIFLTLILIISILISLNLVSASTNVTACGTLNISGETYELNQSISSGADIDDCLVIANNSIILDCAGHNITFGNATGGSGVYVEFDGVGLNNVTVKNCILIQNLSTGDSEGAIFFGEWSENSTVYNNTITVNSTEVKGIMVEANSVNANISSNTIITSGINGTGILLEMNGSGADIRNNIVTTSGEDASGIKISDGHSSGLIYNNTIISSGNWSTTPNTGMGGIWLETDTVGINVSSNNITMSGYDNAGIWVWSCSNHSIENNIITASGEFGNGIYLNGVQGINLTSNTITISGESGNGIRSAQSTPSLLFYNNIITTSGNYSYGINISSNNSNNNISSNNITTSGSYSYGIHSSESHNNTLANNRITTGAATAYVLYFITTSNNYAYNNIFNTSTSGSGVYINDSDLNYFNTTEATATNIIGGPNIGGNFWTNNASTGYSDNCLDADGDYFCDSAYPVVEGEDHTDYLPLTNRNNMLSAAATLNVADRIYYLNQSITVNGTCFNITAKDITLNFNGFNITGNTAGIGVNVTGYNSTKVINGLIYNFSYGIYLENNENNNITNMTTNNNKELGIYIGSSSNNIFNNCSINDSQGSAIFILGATSSNNNFTNMVVTNTNASYYDIYFGTEGINGTWIIDSYLFSYSFTGAGGIVNFKVSGSAIIEFLEPINGSGTNLTLGDVNVENNLVFVNSSSNSGLNKSANITLYSITYTDPKPQYSSDGITFTDCTATTDPACSELSFTGDAFKFNVTHFTYFRSAEAYTAPASSGGGGGSATYQCNDNKDNDGDGLIDYPDDPGCVSRYDSSEGVVKKEECKENWICTSWSECSKEGKQTRTCTDYKKCGTIKEKPTIEQSCTYAPEPSSTTGTAIGEVKQSDGVNWKWDGNVWVKQGTPEYDQIGLEAEKEEVPPQAIIPLKKKTYNTIFTILGIVLVALLTLFLIIKRKKYF